MDVCSAEEIEETSVDMVFMDYLINKQKIKGNPIKPKKRSNKETPYKDNKINECPKKINKSKTKLDVQIGKNKKKETEKPI